MFYNDFANFVSPGDVFILKDTLVKDKDAPPENSRLIRYQRPAIVLHTGYKISTVIHLTTKDGSPETAYSVKVSPDVVSRALFSQITTVDNSRLGKKLGVIRSNVFENMAQKYSNYILGGNPLDYSRSIPIPAYGTDMVSFEPFAYYRDNNNPDRIILALSSGNSSFYLSTFVHLSNDLKSISKRTNTSLPGSIGRNIKLNSLNFLCDEYRDSSWTCVGYETVEATRDKLIEVVNEIFNVWMVKLNTEKVSNSAEYRITSVINKSFDHEKYLEGFDFIMGIDPDIVFSDKIYETSFIVNFCNKNNTDYLINFMRDLHFHKINILGCSIEQLEWLNVNLQNRLMAIVMSFSDNFTQTANGNTLDIDPKVYPGRTIHEENLRWIADYIDRTLNVLHSKAKVYASVMKQVKPSRQKKSKRK